jgi:acyl-coenzyme A thioesterase PaaI-like protein
VARLYGPAVTFAADTAVRVASDGRYDTEIRPGWDIGGNANGGYLLTIAARAMAEAGGRPDPVSVTAHYLAPGTPGPVTVEAGVLRAGRRFATTSAVVRGAERPLLAVLGSFTDHTAPGGATDRPEPVERVDATPPYLPPPSRCVAVAPTDTFPPPFMGRVDLRLHPDDAGFAAGAPSGRPLVRGWFRLRDGEPVDTIALLLAADAFPPTIFNARLPVAWTPTLELTAHVRASPAPGWLRCSFRTRFVTGGYLEEDGEVWDERGRLVAQSRQLALLPRPAPADRRPEA